MAMQMKDVLSRVDEKRLELATRVKIKSLKTKSPKQTNGVFGLAEAKTKSLEKDKWSVYDTTIEFYPKNKVILSCSCPDFMYRWEYALSKRGAARIVYGNGDPPDEANPKLRPGCCKHLVALHDHLIEKGKISAS
jgi:hypothetical protein